MLVTHGKPCVTIHVFTRHMGSHVSTCMECEFCINGGHKQFVKGGGGSRKGKEKGRKGEKGKGEKKERKEIKERKRKRKRER